jgi:hypothetical protein
MLYLECGAFPPLLFLFFVFCPSFGVRRTALFVFLRAVQNAPIATTDFGSTAASGPNQKQKRRKSATLQMKDKKQKKEKQKRRKSAALQIKHSPQSGKKSQAQSVKLAIASYLCGTLGGRGSLSVACASG